MINSFSGEYEFLSNFYPCKIKYNGNIYESTEHAYQCQKATNNHDFELLYKCGNQKLIKRLSREIKIRSDWDTIKVDIMEALLKQKFNIPELKEKLLETNDKKIVEGNFWHDNFWGSCTCPKCQNKTSLNILGKLLMRIRENLR